MRAVSFKRLLGGNATVRRKHDFRTDQEYALQTRELIFTLESEAQSGLFVPSRRAAQCELNGRDSRYSLGSNDTLTDRDLPIQDIAMAEEHRSRTDRCDTVDSEGGHSRSPMLLPNAC